jgi:hypothetical protein
MFGATTSALAAVLLLIVASASGNLAGSTFEGSDGNLVVNTPGNTDWANAPNRVVGLDQPSGPTDNAFGGGTKEDDPNVTVVTGSIPPNKNDLTRFYIGSEFSGGSNFLYLAWERAINIGNANMDLEINQNATTGFTGTTTGPVTLNRTAGDLLVTYDFSGSGSPSLHLLTWVTSGATSQCFSSNSLPCWGNRVDLTGNSEGAVNTATVTDPVPPGAPRTLTTGLFGEAAINLTAAGVFPPGTCEAFGSAFLKSRASSSFPAEVKDFIAPQPVNIANCGTINIIKHTDPRGINQDFNYTSTIPNPVAGQTPPTPDCSLDSTPSSFTLNDSAGVDPSPITGTANTEHCANVPAGSYTVTEGSEPAGFTLESLTCTAGGSQDGTNPFQANITINPGDTVTCTYTNQLNTATMSTTPSNTSNPVVPGSAVHDTATVTGNQATKTPSGTVTFFLCSFPAGSTSTCDGTTNVGVNIGTGTLSGSGATASANSPDVNTSGSPLAAGHYCFRAEWPGDSNYTQALSFDGSNECFDVTTVNSQTVTTPSQSTILLSAINAGSTVTDNALISPATDVGQVTGTVNFFICGPIATGTCTSGGTAVGTDKPCLPAGSGHACLAASDPVGSSIITTVGRYCFRAEYSGDSRYDPSSDSGTLESECFTVTDTSSVTTFQDWLPNDTAEVKSAGGTALSGNVTFTLYDNGTCDGSVKYTESVDVTTGTGTASDETVHTHNTATSSPNFIVTAANNTGAYSWKVTFPGFDSVTGSSSNCESTTGPIVINDNH